MTRTLTKKAHRSNKMIRPKGHNNFSNGQIGALAWWEINKIDISQEDFNILFSEVDLESIFAPPSKTKYDRIDFARMLARNFSDYLGAINLHRNGPGRCYFVAAPYVSTLVEHKKLLADLDSNLYIVPVYQPGDLVFTVKKALEEEINSLEEEIENFRKHLPRLETLELRVEILKSFKRKARMYNKLIGLKSTDLELRADDCDAILSALKEGVKS